MTDEEKRAWLRPIVSMGLQSVRHPHLDSPRPYYTEQVDGVIDALIKNGISHELYEKINVLKEEVNALKSENVNLRERLEKAVELPVPLGTPILKVWKNRVPEDDARMSFVDMWEITVVNFKLEYYPLWDKFYFPNTEEGRETAEARLAELKGGAE